MEADIATVTGAGGAEREALVESFLAKYDPLWKAVAKKYSYGCGVRRSDLDDATQVVRQEACRLLKDGAPPGVSWGQALWRSSQSAIKAWSAGGEVTGFAGMTGHVRRRRSLERMREMTGLDGEPLREAWNAGTASTRSDAKRQGAVATAEDMVEHRIVPSDNEHDPHGGDDPDIDRLLMANVTDEMIMVAVRACSNESRLKGAVAEAWLRGVVADDPMSCTEIARRTGATRSEVQEVMWEVEATVQQAVGDYLLRSG
jgi:hypothetical protein